MTARELYGTPANRTASNTLKRRVSANAERKGEDGDT